MLCFYDHRLLLSKDKYSATTCLSVHTYFIFIIILTLFLFLFSQTTLYVRSSRLKFFFTILLIIDLIIGLVQYTQVYIHNCTYYICEYLVLFILIKYVLMIFISSQIIKGINSYLIMLQ